MIRRVIPDLIEPMTEALERHARGEDVRWELSMVAMPDPSRNGLVSVLALYTEMAGAVLGTKVTLTTMWPPYLTPEACEDTARAALEGMQSARSGQLDSMNEQQRAAYDAGTGAPMSGLITP